VEEGEGGKGKGWEGGALTTHCELRKTGARSGRMRSATIPTSSITVYAGSKLSPILYFLFYHIAFLDKNISLLMRIHFIVTINTFLYPYVAVYVGNNFFYCLLILTVFKKTEKERRHLQCCICPPMRFADYPPPPPHPTFGRHQLIKPCSRFVNVTRKYCTIIYIK
jgi:hypothetical protein